VYIHHFKEVHVCLNTEDRPFIMLKCYFSKKKNKTGMVIKRVWNHFVYVRIS